MTRTSLINLKQRILDAGYDVEYLCDVLCITPEELLEAFEERLVEYQHEFPEHEDLDLED